MKNQQKIISFLTAILIFHLSIAKTPLDSKTSIKSNSNYGIVTFNEIPKNLQLIGRNLTTNLGVVKIIGSVLIDNITDSYSEIIVHVYKNDFIYNTITNSLNYQNNLADFNFTFTIASELSNYDIKIYGKVNGLKHHIKTVNDVVCGDVSSYTKSNTSTDYNIDDALENSPLSFTVSPNPVSNNSLKFNQVYEKIYIKIFSISGQLIKSNTYYKTNKIKLNPLINKGIYILKIRVDGNQFTQRKIIKI